MDTRPLYRYSSPEDKKLQEQQYKDALQRGIARSEDFENASIDALANMDLTIRPMGMPKKSPQELLFEEGQARNTLEQFLRTIMDEDQMHEFMRGLDISYVNFINKNHIALSEQTHGVKKTAVEFMGIVQKLVKESGVEADLIQKKESNDVLSKTEIDQYLQLLQPKLERVMSHDQVNRFIVEIKSKEALGQQVKHMYTNFDKVFAGSTRTDHTADEVITMLIIGKAETKPTPTDEPPESPATEPDTEPPESFEEQPATEPTDPDIEPADKKHAKKKGAGILKRRVVVEPRILTKSNFIPMCRKSVIQKKIIFGSGIDPQKKERYMGFGKYVVHMPSLEKNWINIKYPSSAAVASFPRQRISDETREFIEDLLNNRKVSLPLYEKMSPTSKAYMKSLCQSAGIHEVVGLGVDSADVDEDDEDMKRFMLIKSEIVSGNNAPQLFREFRSYIVKFMNEGRMDRAYAYQLLSDIAMLI
jgi:hypothetical protein